MTVKIEIYFAISDSTLSFHDLTNAPIYVYAFS